MPKTTRKTAPAAPVIPEESGIHPREKLALERHRGPALEDIGGGDPLVADGPTIARAILELRLDVPVYNARVVGDRLELRLFGGKVAYWPPADPVEA
jgi:hypothetical protein